MAIVAVLVALLSFSTKAFAGNDFDYYYFALMWPASYCYQTQAGCCLPTTGKPQLDFFIRGLVPYNSTVGDSLTHCKKNDFNINELSDLSDDLNGYWSNIKCPSSDARTLWKRTWRSYGACSGLREHDYFKKALDLHRKINMLSIFKSNGIVPSGEDFYNLDYIKRVIKKNLGVSVAIQCSKNLWDEWQLYQIYVCVDKDGSTIISCPPTKTFTCGDEVTFGLFTYDMLVDTIPDPKTIKMYSG